MTASTTSPDRDADQGMDWLFLLAMALVFNSHLEEYHLRPWLAGDGLLGNAMFFVLSGYRISLSLARRRDGLLAYLRRRLVRIYPTVWIVTLSLGPTAGWLAPVTTPLHAAEFLLWPTRFTYVAGIVPAYFLLYLLERWRPNIILRSIVCGSLVIAFAGVAMGQTSPGMLSDVHPFTYFLLFFSLAGFGTILAHTTAWRRPGWLLPLLALLITAAYLGVKLMAALSGDWSAFALILSLGGLGAIAIVAAGLPGGTMVTQLHRLPGLPACASFVSRHSLEIYTVHCIVIEWHWLRKLPFPTGIAGAVIVTVALAAIYRKGVARLTAGAHSS